VESLINISTANFQIMQRSGVLDLFLTLALTSLTFILGTKKTGYIRNDMLILGHAGSGFLYPIYLFNPYPSKQLKSHSGDA
jgi:hypothetical protein